LDPALIAQVVLDARAGPDEFDPRTASGLIRARAAVSLPAGVQLITPTVPWSRLVLPEEAGFQLHDAVARLKHQALVIDDWRMGDYARASRGIRLLFTGLPGTGKSLAAEAVASAAATDLLRVDVSQVVSKWLGETEKNLAAVFDVAERCQAVLLLDEADALFGARTQITDAHDRYANLETAYLLQRLDHFDGLAVLATNLRHNIDPAFTRRMDSVVDFALPDLAHRRELWQLHLPPDRIAQGVDIDTLARLYPVAGGWIRNAAITAAFFAAPAGDLIAQHHLVAAMRREYLNAALPFPGEPPRRRDDI
jgi:SpoVK/Ycf46/Vps4 family AAA+-type ATPase